MRVLRMIILGGVDSSNGRDIVQWAIGSNLLYVLTNPSGALCPLQIGVYAKMIFRGTTRTLRRNHRIYLFDRNLKFEPRAIRAESPTSMG